MLAIPFGPFVQVEFKATKRTISPKPKVTIAKIISTYTQVLVGQVMTPAIIAKMQFRRA